MPLIFKNARTSVLLLPLLMVLTACDDNNSPSTSDTTDSGNTNVDSTPPTVISFSPSDGATRVARDSAITATFSEDMFAQTIGESSFIVASDSEVSGTVSFDAVNNVATFEPDRDLALLVTYAATLSTAITDLSGNALATDQTWSFTTSDGVWGTAQLIESDDGAVFSPQIAVDGTGKAFAVWPQSDGTRFNIVSNRFDGSTWGTAELIESDDAGDAGGTPQIAVDGTGKAFAVWEQSDGTRINIVSNRFDGSTWGTAELIETDDGAVFDPQIAVDGTGKALAVWTQSDGTRNNIVSNRFDGSTWGSAELIETGDGGAFNPQIAVDGTGKALAVWQQSDGTRQNIVSNRFDGSTWGTAQLIESDDAGSASLPQIAVDGTGKALAVWTQSDGTRNNIVSNRFDGSTWGTAELIETDDGAVSNPQIAVDGTGKALAVWTQSDGTRNSTVSNRFDGSTWGTAELIETGDGGAFNPQIAVDGTGKALAVWQQNDGTRTNIVSNRFDGSTWGTAELIESDDAGDARNPQIAVDGTGKALAVWQQNDGTRNNIVSNRFE